MLTYERVGSFKMFHRNARPSGTGSTCQQVCSCTVWALRCCSALYEIKLPPAVWKARLVPATNRPSLIVAVRLRRWLHLCTTFVIKHRVQSKQESLLYSLRVSCFVTLANKCDASSLSSSKEPTVSIHKGEVWFEWWSGELSHWTGKIRFARTQNRPVLWRATCWANSLVDPFGASLLNIDLSRIKLGSCCYLLFDRSVALHNHMILCRHIGRCGLIRSQVINSLVLGRDWWCTEPDFQWDCWYRCA